MTSRLGAAGEVIAGEVIAGEVVAAIRTGKDWAILQVQFGTDWGMAQSGKGWSMPQP